MKQKVSERQEDERERYNTIFGQRNPTVRRGSAFTYDPDRPTTLVAYEAKYPKLQRQDIFYHFKEGKHSVNQIAEWVGYNVPDFRPNTLEGTESSKSPRSHVRGQLEKLVDMGFLEKDSTNAPVVYQLTDKGQQENKAIFDKLTADAK